MVPTFTLKPGERGGDKVYQLENMLIRIHPYYDWSENDAENVYGADLQKKVRDFQKRAGFKASGIVGPKTVAALNEVVSVSGQWGC